MKELPKKACKMQNLLMGAVPKHNTYAGPRKPVKKK